MIFDDEIIAIEFLVIAQIGNISANRDVWLRILITVLIGRSGIIDYLQFPHRSIVTILKRRLQEFILVTRKKNRRSSMNAHGRDNAAEVGVSAGDAAGAHEHVLNDNLFLLIYNGVTPSRTVDEHHWMHAAEEIIGLEFQMEADARIAVAPAFASFEANGHI